MNRVSELPPKSNTKYIEQTKKALEKVEWINPTQLLVQPTTQYRYCNDNRKVVGLLRANEADYWQARKNIYGKPYSNDFNLFFVLVRDVLKYSQLKSGVPTDAVFERVKVSYYDWSQGRGSRPKMLSLAINLPVDPVHYVSGMDRWFETQHDYTQKRVGENHPLGNCLKSLNLIF